MGRSSTVGGSPGPSRSSHGMHIELGDCRLEVAERVDRAAAGRTVSVPAGISLIVEQPSVRRTRLRGQQNRKPKLRSGWSLKRLEESEAVGGARFVLKDHRSSVIVRLATEEAELAQLLDGDHDLVSLLGEAAARWGADGPARLARLLAELADKGMLSGVESEEPSGSLPWLARLIRPRERELPGVPAGDGGGVPPRRLAAVQPGGARGAGGHRRRVVWSPSAR